MRELSSDLNHDENLKSLIKQIEQSEIVSVCKDLTDGTADQTVYEHVKYGGPYLWKMFHVLCNKMLDSVSVPSGSLMGMILPLFNGEDLQPAKKTITGTSLCFQ